MKIDILTLFPRMFDAVLGESMMKRAQMLRRVEIRIHDIRDFTHDRHKSADDKPFGGGSGMVMKPEPIFEAMESILGSGIDKKKLKKKGIRTVFLTPQGKRFDQRIAKKVSRTKRLVLLCGHYEGIDERVRKHLVMDEISIGDYILTCGELPAMVLIDSVARLIPGVLGNENSSSEESFEDGLLEYPQYTRPAVFRKMKVPATLLSGNHKGIQGWRKTQALLRTRRRRPDLLK